MKNWKENPTIRVKKIFHPLSITINSKIIFLTYLEAQGLNYREIGEKVGKTRKQIDNTIQRIKAKTIKLNRSAS
jgi:transposase